MIDKFIGTEFTTITGSVLTVVGILSKDKWGKNIYSISCSTCNKDKELFPEYFSALKVNLLKGSIPCGCSKRPIMSESQNRLIVERICIEKNISLIGWYGKYKKSNTLLSLKCNVCNTAWNSTDIKYFLCKKSGCPSCGRMACSEKFKLKNAEIKIIDILRSEGFNEDIEWITESKKYENYDSKFKYSHHLYGEHIISYHNFINGSRGIGVNRAKCGFKGIKEAYLYIVKWTDGNSNWIKFGITNNNDPQKRYKQQQHRNIKINNVILEYEQLELYKFDSGTDALNVETSLKSLRKKYNDITKDFMADGFTECLPEHSIPEIKNILSQFNLNTVYLKYKGV